MLLRPPWKSAAPGAPYRLNGASPLSRGLLFAWSGHLGLDLVGGGRPTNTAVTEASAFNRRSWSFAGGIEGASDLNFGQVASTMQLHQNPATWAFYAVSNVVSQTALACQTDANVSAGWQVGFGNSGNIGMTLVRAGTDVRKSINELPTAGVPYTLVYTSDGSNTAANQLIYLNGVLGTANTSTNGTAPSASSGQNLYLGRRRFDSPLSFNGQVFVALIAGRTWSDAEARAFHEDPYRAFLVPKSVTYSFAGVVPLGASGTAGMVFGATGRLGAKIPAAGSAGMTFGASGTAVAGSVVTVSSGGSTGGSGRRKASIFSPLISVNLPGGSTLLDRTQAAIKRAMDAIAQGQIGNLSERAGVWTITPGPANPVGNPPKGSWFVYCDAVDRKWKSRGSNGTITILGAP